MVQLVQIALRAKHVNTATEGLMAVSSQSGPKSKRGPFHGF
jgi:hypothetical protein